MSNPAYYHLPDFCSGNSQNNGPAGTVLDIFKERGIEKDDTLYAAFVYYQSVRKCVVVLSQVLIRR